MLPIFILFFGLTIVLSSLTAIPFSIAALVASTVLFKKSWLFFAAFFLGLFLDLILVRPLGYTSLVFTIFVFLIFLYERKFETKTTTFVFFSTFLGSLAYLWILEYQMVFLQAFISALLAVLFFRVILSKAKNLDSSPSTVWCLASFHSE